MTELELDSGIEIDPEELFNEGYQTGAELESEELREQIEDQLIDEGFDPDDIDEMLYDPAPRRGRRRHRRSHRSYDPAPRRRRRSRRRSGRRYDPAPRRGSKSGYYGKLKKKYGKHAKGMLGKFRKFALPGAAGLTFLGAYMTRASQLGVSVPDAITKDIKEFDGKAAMKRVQDSAGEIATPLVAGWAIKETKVAGKYSGLIGDVLTGIGLGTFAKKVLDPPVGSNHSHSPSVISQDQNHIQIIESVDHGFKNPYA